MQSHQNIHDQVQNFNKIHVEPLFTIGCPVNRSVFSDVDDESSFA